MIPRLGLALAACFFCLPLRIWCQTGVSTGPYSNENLRFASYSTENGLSHPVVFSMIQDQQGYLWIGTQTGLNRFDGYEFKVYKRGGANSANLSGNYVTALFCDRKGLIWIGTFGSGITILDPATDAFTTLRAEPRNPVKLSDGYIRGFLEDEKGNIWIATGRGLNRTDGKKLVFRKYFRQAGRPGSLLDNDTLCLFRDHAGKIWVGSNSGLSVYSSQTDSFEHILSKSTRDDRIIDRCVQAIGEDRDGKLWVGTKWGGIYIYDGQKKLLRVYRNDLRDNNSISDNTILTILRDKSQRMWIGTEMGLNLFDDQREGFQRIYHRFGEAFSISSNTVNCLGEDVSGNIWFGTNGAGINKYSPLISRFHRFTFDSMNLLQLFNRKVFGIYEDPERNVWLGVWAGGLIRLKRNRETWDVSLKNPPILVNALLNNVMAVISDVNNEIWIGSFGYGLNRYDRKTGAFIHFENPYDGAHADYKDTIRVLRRGRANIFWLGTFGAGLHAFDPQTKSWRHFLHSDSRADTLSANNVTAIIEDWMGMIWVGTADTGLNVLNPETGGINRLDDRAGKEIVSFFEDQKKNMWVGTTEGLVRYERKTSSWRTFTQKDGLSSNIILAILQDESDYLWLSTNLGLIRFNPVTFQSNAYTQADGIHHDQFAACSCFRGKSGILYFGGINGFTFFSPKEFRHNPYVPPVVITRILLNNQSLRESAKVQLIRQKGKPERILLEKNQWNLTFTFSALDYTGPEKNLYAYHMEGIDEPGKWHVCDGKNRTANYSLDQSGLYIFKVKGSNSDRVWNERGASVIILLKKSRWTLWIWLGSILIIATGGTLLFLYIRKRNILIPGQIPSQESIQEAFAAKGISKREAEIVQLLYSGKTNDEIAGLLSISSNTVRNHVASVYHKLGVTNRVELLHFLQRNMVK